MSILEGLREEIKERESDQVVIYTPKQSDQINEMASANYENDAANFYTVENGIHYTNNVIYWPYFDIPF